MNSSSQSLILLSGGIDSSACLAFYKRLGYSTPTIFIDYGQPARVPERASAESIADYYSVPFEIVVCNGPETSFAGEIWGRNAFLLMTALLYNQVHRGIIALGIHAGTPYYDCQTEFVQSISHIIEGYSQGRILVGAPFLSWTKDMVWKFAVETNVPLNLTWSCEVGTVQPCGDCLSCRDIEALNARTK